MSQTLLHWNWGRALCRETRVPRPKPAIMTGTGLDRSPVNINNHGFPWCQSGAKGFCSSIVFLWVCANEWPFSKMKRVSQQLAPTLAPSPASFTGIPPIQGSVCGGLRIPVAVHSPEADMSQQGSLPSLSTRILLGATGSSSALLGLRLVLSPISPGNRLREAP